MIRAKTVVVFVLLQICFIIYFSWNRNAHGNLVSRTQPGVPTYYPGLNSLIRGEHASTRSGDNYISRRRNMGIKQISTMQGGVTTNPDLNLITGQVGGGHAFTRSENSYISRHRNMETSTMQGGLTTNPDLNLISRQVGDEHASTRSGDSRVNFVTSKKNIVVCSAVYDKRQIKYFGQWLQHLYDIKVDKVGLIVHALLKNRLKQSSSLVFNIFRKNGFVDIKFTKYLTNLKSSQPLQFFVFQFYQECIRHYRNSFKFLFPMKFNDYIVSLNRTSVDIHKHLKKLFESDLTGSVTFSRNWANQKVKITSLRFFRILLDQSFQSKTIYRLSAVKEVNSSSEISLLKRYRNKIIVNDYPLGVLHNNIYLGLNTSVITPYSNSWKSTPKQNSAAKLKVNKLDNITLEHDKLDSQPKIWVPVISSNLILSSENVMDAIPPSEGNKLVIPISAYFDDRPRGIYSNATIILANILNSVYSNGDIVGCQVDQQINTQNFGLKPVHLTHWVRFNKPKIIYTDVIVLCYDMPLGTNASLIYRRVYRKNSYYFRVYSEKKILVPDVNRKTYPPYKHSVIVCTIGYGTPLHFEEWLKYQMLIGVDLVHLNVQESFVNQTFKKSTWLQKYIKRGFVNMEVWKTYLNATKSFYYSQSLLYQDCIRRYRHSHDFILMVDVDDYFIPRIPDKVDIHDYIDKLFPFTLVGAVKIQWIEYYCYPKLKTGRPTSNLTRYVDHSKYTILRPAKAMYRLPVVEEVAIHEPTFLLPPYSTLTLANANEVYIAHMRVRTTLAEKHCRGNDHSVEASPT